MRYGAGFVSIRMEIIAGKLLTIPAEVQPFALGTFIGSTAMRFAENLLLKRYLPIVVATPTTKHSFYWNVKFLRPMFNLAHCPRILMSQEEGAIKAIKSTGGRHLKVIHD
jgi:hypothetical protein